MCVLSRTRYVGVLGRFVRRQRDVTDDAELAAVWALAVGQVVRTSTLGADAGKEDAEAGSAGADAGKEDAEAGSAGRGGRLADVRVNAGACQSVGHLHIKARPDDAAAFQARWADHKGCVACEGGVRSARGRGA